MTKNEQLSCLLLSIVYLCNWQYAYISCMYCMYIICILLVNKIKNINYNTILFIEFPVHINCNVSAAV